MEGYGLIRGEFWRARGEKEDGDDTWRWLVERWFIYNVCKERKTVMAARARAYAYLHFPASLLSPAFFWHNRTEGAGRGYAIGKCPPYFTYRSEDTSARFNRVPLRQGEKGRKKERKDTFPSRFQNFFFFFSHKWNFNSPLFDLVSGVKVTARYWNRVCGNLVGNFCRRRDEKTYRNWCSWSICISHTNIEENVKRKNTFYLCIFIVHYVWNFN